MKKCLLYLLALLVVTACNEDFGSDTPEAGNKMFGTSTKFLKLQDDSTKVAGILEITANAPSVELKWNVLPGCNLDTTITKLDLERGVGKLPIHWLNQQETGGYGPRNVGYEAGVLITSGENSQYVPLFWADEIDSTQINNGILTRASEEIIPKATIVTVDPFLLKLDKDTCGTFHVTFSGFSCTIDKSPLNELEKNGAVLNLDKNSIPSTLRKDQNELPLQWDSKGAPESSFAAHLKLTSGSYSTYAYMQYIALAAPYWEFVNTIPADNKTLIDAVDGYVIVNVKTNRQWSIESDQAEVSPVESPEIVDGAQSLVIKIKDNLDPVNKDIIITVKSNVPDPANPGKNYEEKITLKQKPGEGVFKVNTIDPVNESNISSGGQTMTVDVTTSREWWILLDGIKTKFYSTDASGSIDIPVNSGTTTKKVYVTIGYDDVIAETVTYTQPASDDISYESSSLADVIPVEGGTYTFTFVGSYSGNLQVRALQGDVVLATGIATTNKQPAVTVPSNSKSTSERPIRFEYRLGLGDWKNDMAATDRQQQGGVITGKVLPTGDIPAEGGPYSCIFTGSYTGNVILRAEVDGTPIQQAGTSPGAIEVDIPSLTGTADRAIPFSYSTDGGTTWEKIATKTQAVGTIRYGSITPAGDIPATGNDYSCAFSGTYTGTVYFRAKTGDNVWDTKSGLIPATFTLTIPKNATSADREVVFEYSKDGTSWNEMEKRTQKSDIKVDPSDPNVGEFEDGGNKDVDVEL